MCAGCHKVDGTAATGPALNLIWGENENLHGGGTVFVDENYVRDSILQPDKHVVAGYGPVSKMNSFQGKLSDVQIDYLIAYMKYLKTGETGDDAAAGNDEAADGESTGDENAGDENAGDENAGDENAGDENAGDEASDNESAGEESADGETSGDNENDGGDGDENA